MTIEAEDPWDFYFCELDNARASIWINLRYRDPGATPQPNAGTLYWLRIAMLDVGGHGMGTEAEAATLWPIEEEVARAARDSGVEYVARVRTSGRWEMTFYGRARQEGKLEACVAALQLGGRGVEIGSRRDAKWERYRELLPDAERWQWMQNRRLAEVLEENGDDPEIPRRVDHWAYFPSKKQRSAFVKAVAAHGFKNDRTNAPEPDDTFGARVFRTDRTELESIHAAVMLLWVVAKEHGGQYDGWETSVEKPS